jgi:hypothetical protein
LQGKILRASNRHSEGNSALAVALSGLIDIRAQGEVPSARRTDTPRAIRLSAMRSPV